MPTTILNILNDLSDLDTSTMGSKKPKKEEEGK